MRWTLRTLTFVDLLWLVETECIFVFVYAAFNLFFYVNMLDGCGMGKKMQMQVFFLKILLLRKENLLT